MNRPIESVPLLRTRARRAAVRYRMTLATLSVLLLCGVRGAGAQAHPFGLTVDPAGTLRKEGKPYRGVGVNYFDAFARTLADPRDTSFEQGFKTLEDFGIPFCRIMAGGYWPKEQQLYSDDPREFFRRLDGVVNSARRHHLGLISSCFWYLATVPDTVGEPVSAWGDAKSKTRAYMRRYVKDVVTRYRDEPAIWGWEFGNEYCLAADLPNASEHRPAVAPSLGTPAARTAADEIGYAALHNAYAGFAREVRRYDRYRMIETGDSMPRESAWHNWREKSWTKDLPEQEEEILDEANPAPIDVVSVHFYKETAGKLREIARYARLRKKPLFVGEFGAEGKGEAVRARFNEILTTIQDAGVPLAALWVYDFAGQDESWNVAAKNERAYQLAAVAEANKRMQAAAN